MKHSTVLSFLVLLFCISVFGVEVSRITHLLSFLNSHVAADPGTTQIKLHPAYYGAEILDILSKHPGYIQAGILSASQFTYKLCSIVSELQIKNEGEKDFGGFRPYYEKKKMLTPILI